MTTFRHDCRMVKYVPDANDAFNRLLSDKLSEFVSVKDRGAAGDGTTDDIEAFVKAYDMLPNGGKLYIPRGTYYLSEQWVLGEASRRNILLFGDGIKVSNLLFGGATKGIRFHGGTAGDDWRFFMAHGFSINLSGVEGGTAIDARWTNIAGTVDPSLVINDVEIAGAFSTGIYGYDAKQARIYNAQILGDPSDINQMAAAIHFRSGDPAAEGVAYGYASDMVVSGCSISWASYGVLVDQEPGQVSGTSVEGVLVTNCTMAAVNVGIRTDTLATEPMMNAVNNHIAARTFCIDTEHHNSSIVGNSFYQTADSTTDCTAVNLRSGAFSVDIVGNTFSGVPAGAYGSNAHGQGSNGKYFNGVVANSGASDIVVSANIFWSVFGPIWWQSGSVRCSAYDNHFRNVGNVEVLNEAAAVTASNFNDRNVRRDRARVALLTRSADQAIADNTLTRVELDTNRYKTEDGMSNTVSNRLVVPPGATLVRLNAQVTFDNKAPTRYVGLFIRKNGSVDYPGAGYQAISTDDGVQAVHGHALNAQTAVLHVAPGDYFDVAVQHLSEANPINIMGDAGGRFTWFCMEVLE